MPIPPEVREFLDRSGYGDSLSPPGALFPQPEALGRDRTLLEAIGGGIQKGALGVAKGFELAGEAIAGVDPRFSTTASLYQQMLAEHPTWHAQDINSALDLITNPTELAGTIAESIPYMTALLAGGAVGVASGTGLAIPFAIGSMIEGGNAYSDAIQDGATPEQAEITGLITGTISGAIELLPLNSVMTLAKGGKTALAKAASKAGLRRLGSNFIAGSGGYAVARVAALEGLEEVLQGTTGEVTAWGVYNKDIPAGFVSRRLLEFTGGAAAGGFFGLGGLGAGKVITPVEETKNNINTFASIAKANGIDLSFDQARKTTPFISDSDFEFFMQSYPDLRPLFKNSKDLSGEEISIEPVDGMREILEGILQRASGEAVEQGRESVAREFRRHIEGDLTKPRPRREVPAPIITGTSKALEPTSETLLEDRSVLSEEEAIREPLTQSTPPLVPPAGEGVPLIEVAQEQEAPIAPDTAVTPEPQQDAFEEAVETTKEEGQTRESFYTKFFDAFYKDKMSQEDFDAAIVPLVESHAVVWAANTGRSVDEWFSTVRDIETAEGTGERFAEAEIRGSFRNATGILRAFFNTDAPPEAGMHELLHLWQAQMTPELNSRVLTELGVDEWTPEARESFVDGALKWFRTGKDSNEAQRSIPKILQDAYERFASWLKKLFPSIRRTVLNNAPNSAAIQALYREAFVPTEEQAQDRLDELRGQVPVREEVEAGEDIQLDLSDVAEESPFTISARPEIGFGEKTVRKIKKDLLEKADGGEAELTSAELKVKLKDKNITPVEVLADLALQFDEEGRAFDVIWDDETGEFTLTVGPEGEANPDPTAYTVGMPVQVSFAGGVKSFFNSRIIRDITEMAQTLLDISAPLKRQATGRETRDMLGRIQTDSDTLEGRANHLWIKAHNNLTREDFKWIREHDSKTQITNQRKLLDEQEDPQFQTVSPNERITAWRDATHAVNRLLGEEAEANGVLRKEGSWFVPFKPSPVGRLVRSLMPGAREALLGNDKEFKAAIVAKIIELNPKMEKLQNITSSLQEWATRRVFVKSHMLEFGRIIKIMPDFVTVNDKERQVLEIDPGELMHQTVHNQALRIATIKHLGHRGLGSGLNYAKGLTKALGLQAGLTRSNADKRFRIAIEMGTETSAYEGMTSKQLDAYAKTAGININVKNVDHLNALIILDSITEAQKKKITPIVRKMRGVDRDFTWDEVKGRLLGDTENVYKRMLEDFKAEGGREKVFNEVVALSQGLYNIRTGQNSVSRFFNFMLSMIGTGQVSRAAIPNLPQTALVVPGFTGMKNYLSAVSRVVTGRQAMIDRNIEIGAFTPKISKRMLSQGTFLRDAGKWLRNGVSRIVLLNWATTNNNVIAAEAFRGLADDWRGVKLPPSQVAIARRLDLSERDIGMLEQGQMDTELFNRIVQNGVAMTQFLNKPRFKRGILEVNPYLRAIFPYMNYAANTGVIMVGQGKEFINAVQRRDFPNSMVALRRITSTLTRMALGGMLVNAMRKAIGLRRREEPDRTLAEEAYDGLISTAFLGPINRMSAAFDVPIKDSGDFAQRFSPKLKAFFDFSLTAIDESLKLVGREGQFGRYADFGPGTRFGKLVRKNFGAMDSAIRAIENQVYPHMAEYNSNLDTRKAFEKQYISNQIRDARSPQAKSFWKQKQRDSQIFSGRPSDPVKSEIFEAVRDGMPTLAAELTRTYYQESFLAGIPFDKAKASLKSSLQGRAPLRMDTDLVPIFLRTLNAEDRKNQYQTHQRYVSIVRYVTQ